MADTAVLKSEVNNLKISDSKQWKAIEDLRRYMRKLVPVWVTIVVSVLTFITGCSLTFAGMIIKFAGN